MVLILAWFSDRLPITLKTLIPQLVLLAVVIFYLIIGAVAIRSIETSLVFISDDSTNSTGEGKSGTVYLDLLDAWEFWNALLFCFVTITSIGRRM